MKMHFCLMIGALLLTSTFAAYAQAAKEGGGGDVCQNRIEEIRNNISDWINAGLSANLNFANSRTTLADYNQRMQNEIALTRQNDQSSISCTDNAALVQVNGAQKTCVAFPDADRPRILCYRGQSNNGRFINGFMGLSEDDQYFQVHHEFAVLAGLEDQPGAKSDYSLSEQISGNLIEEVVRRLPVAPVPSNQELNALKDAFDLAMSKASFKCTGDFWSLSGEYRGLYFVNDPRSSVPGTAEVQTNLAGGIFSVVSKSPLQIFVSNFVHNNENVPFATPEYGDMVSQVMVLFSSNSKTVKSVELKMFVYENTGTVTNPVVGLPVKPNYHAYCVSEK